VQDESTLSQIQIDCGYDFIRRLYCNAHIIAQELGREVGSIRPDERVKLRMNMELLEDRGIAQRFEDGAAESRRQIDLAAGSIPKAKPHDVTGHIARLDNVIVRDPHSSRTFGPIVTAESSIRQNNSRQMHES